jgi:hypothetical protein
MTTFAVVMDSRDTVTALVDNSKPITRNMLLATAKIVVGPLNHENI